MVCVSGIKLHGCSRSNSGPVQARPTFQLCDLPWKRPGGGSLFCSLRPGGPGLGALGRPPGSSLAKCCPLAAACCSSPATPRGRRDSPRGEREADATAALGAGTPGAGAGDALPGAPPGLGREQARPSWRLKPTGPRRGSQLELDGEEGQRELRPGCCTAGLVLAGPGETPWSFVHLPLVAPSPRTLWGQDTRVFLSRWREGKGPWMPPRMSQVWASGIERGIFRPPPQGWGCLHGWDRVLQPHSTSPRPPAKVTRASVGTFPGCKRVVLGFRGSATPPGPAGSRGVRGAGRVQTGADAAERPLNPPGPPWALPA